jgi:lipopolysaccharide/colanic/teichoic acid biosynthesis glycosyltransferase
MADQSLLAEPLPAVGIEGLRCQPGPSHSAPVPFAVDHRPIWYRAFEFSAALAALVVFLPLMLIVALLIKIDSRGPVLFRQQRLARGGKTFTFVKFRTMAVDGNVRFPQLSPDALRKEETSQLRLQLDDDPRVTRTGRWLRRTSIDEIPNFIHVLTGDMSLVGPRPEMPEILPHYSQNELAKFSVVPGITGYAQIYGRGELSFVETVAHDLKYVRERSVRVDLLVLWKTVWGVLSGRGAW